jgi:hypothetical protein
LFLPLQLAAHSHQSALPTLPHLTNTHALSPCRSKNSRFDVIGGAIYFLAVVSVLPRCSAGAALLSAASAAEFVAALSAEFVAAWRDILMSSRLSLVTAVAFFLVTLGFARGGGVGAVSGEIAARQRQQAAARRRALRDAQKSGVGSAPAARGQGGGGQPRRRSPVVGPLVRLRTGGLLTQLTVAALHAGAHLSLAVLLMLLLELGVELCIK